MSVAELAVAVAIPVAVLLTKAVLAWMQKQGSSIEIREGNRKISTITAVGGDQSELLKRIQEEFIKDKQKRPANMPSATP